MPIRRGDLNPATVVAMAILVASLLAQTIDPELLDALRRDPAALADGQWWRVATPLLVQEAGPLSALILIIFLGWLGTTLEPVIGSLAVAALLLVGAVTGELGGYAWHPFGAGSSVAIAGLVGALPILFAERANPLGIEPRARRLALVGAGAILFGAVALCAVADLHGPPILAGALTYLGLRRLHPAVAIPSAGA